MPASNPSHALRVLCLPTGDARDWDAPLAVLEHSPWGPFEV